MIKLILGGIKEVVWPLIGWVLGFSFVLIVQHIVHIQMNPLTFVSEFSIPIIFIVIGTVIYKKK